MRNYGLEVLLFRFRFTWISVPSAQFLNLFQLYFTSLVTFSALLPGSFFNCLRSLLFVLPTCKCSYLTALVPQLTTNFLLPTKPLFTIQPHFSHQANANFFSFAFSFPFRNNIAILAIICNAISRVGAFYSFLFTSKRCFFAHSAFCRPTACYCISLLLIFVPVTHRHIYVCICVYVCLCVCVFVCLHCNFLPTKRLLVYKDCQASFVIALCCYCCWCCCCQFQFAANSTPHLLHKFGVHAKTLRHL